LRIQTSNPDALKAVHDFLRFQIETEDFLGIGVFRVSSAWPVASFTSVGFQPFFGLENDVRVAGCLNLLELVFVASLARVWPNILGCRRCLGRSFLRSLAGNGTASENGANKQPNKCSP